MQKSDSNKIVVIGAGIVGVCCAIHLNRLGKQVVIIDKKGVGEATSFGNAGVLACCSIVPVTTPGILLRAPSLLFGKDGALFLRFSYLPKLLPWLIPYLRSAKPEKVEYIAKNSLPLVSDSVEEHFKVSQDAKKAQRWLKKTPYMFVYKDYQSYKADDYSWKLRQKHGFEWEVLQDEKLWQYEPAISKDYRCGVLLQHHGMVSNPGQYIKDLAESAIAAGVELRIAKVDDIQQKEDGVVVKTDSQDITASKAVIASGVWSNSLAKPHGANVPLESERGYHVELSEPSVKPSIPIMYTEHKFVVTPMSGGLRMAGLVEFGGLHAAAARKPTDLLIRCTKKLLPSLQFKSKRLWLGHRPSTHDSLPVIGRAPLSKDVYFCYGHCHTGLTAGPKTARMIAEMIVGNQPNIDMSAYKADRYS